MRVLAALALAAVLPAATPAPVRVEAARVVARLPHDRRAFTEGFFWRDGAFYESTGEVGASTIRKVDPATGKVLASVAVPPPYFGEGIAAVGREIFSLTWQHGVGFRWSIDGFRPLGRFTYTGEGWALASDARLLVMSDGTDRLRVLDRRTLAVTRTIAVTLDGRPLDQLNEIEIVDGEILANVWRTDRIARINPASGRVVGMIDVSALTAEVRPRDAESVPNGIAWDAKHRKLYVTGKRWPTIFEIEPPRKYGMAG